MEGHNVDIKINEYLSLTLIALQDAKRLEGDYLRQVFGTRDNFKLYDATWNANIWANSGHYCYRMVAYRYRYTHVHSRFFPNRQAVKR